MLNPNDVSMIQGLAQAAMTLSNVTGSDDQTKSILRNIDKLVNPQQVTAGCGKSEVTSGTASRLQVFDDKGVRRLQVERPMTWRLEANGNLVLNNANIVGEYNQPRPSIEERTRNMSERDIITLAKTMAQEPDTSIGELQQLAQLVGRSAALMLF